MNFLHLSSYSLNNEKQKTQTLSLLGWNTSLILILISQSAQYVYWAVGLPAPCPYSSDTRECRWKLKGAASCNTFTEAAVLLIFNLIYIKEIKD